MVKETEMKLVGTLSILEHTSDEDLIRMAIESGAPKEEFLQHPEYAVWLRKVAEEACVVLEPKENA